MVSRKNSKRAREESSEEESSSEEEVMSSSTEESSPSPSPVRKTKKVAVRKTAATKTKKAKGDRKPTHWMSLVKATFAVGDVKGSAGLTAAMTAAKPSLPEFKVAFPDGVPTAEAAVAWVRTRQPAAPAPTAAPVPTAAVAAASL